MKRSSRKEKDFSKARSGNRGDAAVPSVPVPAGRDAESRVEALRYGVPASYSFWDTHAGRGAAGQRRAGRTGNARRASNGRAAHARRPEGAGRRG